MTGHPQSNGHTLLRTNGKEWPYVKLLRDGDALELLASSPNAFALLTLIALRARRTDKFNRHNLMPGEALVGDFRACGLTEREYRTAKAFLQKHGFATFNATSKGTIATLSNGRVFDLTIEIGGHLEGGKNDGHSDGHPDPEKPHTSNGVSNGHVHLIDEQNASQLADDRRTGDEQATSNKNGGNALNGEMEGGEAAPPAALPLEVEFWNAHCGNLSKVLSFNHGRQQKLADRKRDRFWRDNFEAAVLKVAASDFCNGKNKRSWPANFDWLLKPDSLTKVMEGNYDNRTPGGGAKHDWSDLAQ